MSLPRHVIIACTSASAALHGEGHKTGLFIGEALHPFNVFKNAGFEVDLVSETGAWFPDWLSEQPDFLGVEDRKQWEDSNGEFRKKVDNMHKPAEIDATKVSTLLANV
jgi:D-lactate dehydratase